MKTILIVGAGQLGSRHLQGVKLSANELDIWVYDLSRDSLKIAEERYNQIKSPNFKSVHFVNDFKNIPVCIDVAIIATSSKPRYCIVKELLYSHNIKFMVLEKFLFPRINDYEEIGFLLEQNGTRAFVNCTRRMFAVYSIIKENIDFTKPIVMEYRGKDWGLCCNSIHMIDIFMMLTNENDFDINIEELIPEVIDSKRSGYVELRGLINITTAKQNKLVLSSTIDFDEVPLIKIKNNDREIILNESTGELLIEKKRYCYPLAYQSAVSGIVVDSLLTLGTCPLTPYHTSANYHKLFLKTIASFINKLKGWTSDSCPIT